MIRRGTRIVLGITECLLLAAGCAICDWGQGGVASSATTLSEAMRNGQSAISRNDLAAAQTWFERAVHLAPQNEQSHAELGKVLLQRNKAAEAVPELESAHALARSDVFAELNLALAYQQLHRTTEAVALFTEAFAEARVSKRPISIPVRAAYARALATTGNLPQAAMEMETVVKAEPRNAAQIGYLGSIYAQEKHWPIAKKEFRAEVALEPNGAIGHLRLGLAMRALHEPNALEQLAQAVKLAPDDVGIQLEWGKALAGSGDDAQAITIFEHLLAVRPDFMEAADQLAQAYQRDKRVPEAIDWYQKVLASGENAAVLTNLGMAYTQEQHAKEGIPYLQRAVTLDPKSATAHEDLAAAYVQLNQLADAAAELRLALDLAPDSSQLHYNLGLVFKNQDDAARAIPELEQAAKLDAAAPEAPYLLGVLYMQAGRYGEAARELESSLRLRPENGDGWATLGSVYNRLEELPEAVTALRKAIDQLPSQPDPHLTLAAVLTKQNHTAEAMKERKEAATLMRANMNHERAEVATNSANSLLKSGDIAGALRQFQEALSYDAAYAEAHLGMASIYEAQGKSAEAAAERQKAAENPNVP